MQPYKLRPRDRATELLRAYIIEHNLQPDERLPSERDLCESWALNRSTLRSAIGALERDGLLYSLHGAGTFLARPKFSRNLQDLHALSYTAAGQQRTLTTRLLSLERVECDKTLARAFGQMLGYRVYKIVRLRLLDGQPLMLETAFVPASGADELPEQNLETTSLFALLESYGHNPKQGEEKVGITYATADEAQLMDIEEESPLIWLVSKTYNQHDLLMEYCRTIARPDRLRLTSALEQRNADSVHRRRL